MISLSQFFSIAYQHTIKETKQHLLQTVFLPFYNNNNNNNNNEYDRIFAAPPSCTNVRYMGWNITEQTERAARYFSEINQNDNNNSFETFLSALTENVDISNFQEVVKRYVERSSPQQWWDTFYHAPERMTAIGLPFCFVLQPKPFLLEKEFPPYYYHNSVFQKDVFHAINTVIVDVGCAEAVLRGSDVYAPGVITAQRHFTANELVHLAVVVERKKTNNNNESEYSYQCASVKGLQLPSFVYSLDAQNHKNMNENDETEYFTIFIGEGITRQSWKEVLNKKSHGLVVETFFSSGGQPSLQKINTLFHLKDDKKENSLFLQNYSSMIPVSLLVNRIKPYFHNQNHNTTLRVLDSCAAPGGKTSLLLSLLREESNTITNENACPYHVTCCERSKPRYKALVKWLSEQFPTSENEKNSVLEAVLNPILGDVNAFAKQLLQKKENNNNNENNPFFHAVLLDPPCTGLGLRPRLLPHHHSLTTIQEHADFQRKIFDSSYKLIRNNHKNNNHKEKNYIVYSTCTITVEENEENVLYFLKTYLNLLLCRAESAEEVHLTKLSSVNGGNGQYLLKNEIETIQKEREKTFSKSNENDVLLLRFMPPVDKNGIAAAQDDSVGFFVALFEIM